MNAPRRPPTKSPSSGTRVETDEEIRQAMLPRSGTEIETDEEIRQALTAKFGTPAPAQASSEPVAVPTSKSAVMPYRPILRPPIAELTILDDAKPEGERIRIRSDRFVVGRTEGDLLIPHDGLISDRHIELKRVNTGDTFRWIILDQQATSGLFVRVRVALLIDPAEFLAGMGRFRFESPANLIEILPAGKQIRHPVTQPEVWIGTDPSCEIHRPNDPFMEPRHVRLFQDKKGWHIQHYKSQNGLWLRVNQIAVETNCMFQIGEQRFRLQVGG